MSLILEKPLSWLDRLLVRLLRCGKIPKHVAFIMDGNRRFAKRNNIEKIEGHRKGFDKLSEALLWCDALGISEVTVYAFSIENYKRSEEEINDLMDLALQKFRRILDEREKLKEKGIRIRVIGNRSLLSDDFCKTIAEVEVISKDNKKSLLNVAFSYTAQDEMTHSINSLLDGLESGSIFEDDLNLNLLSHCLYTRDSRHPELIIRTSGETRLSDFLLFQGSYSYLFFTGALWPDLRLQDMLWGIFQYQNAVSLLQEVRSKFTYEPLTENSKKFLDLLA